MIVQIHGYKGELFTNFTNFSKILPRPCVDTLKYKITLAIKQEKSLYQQFHFPKIRKKKQ